MTLTLQSTYMDSQSHGNNLTGDQLMITSLQGSVIFVQSIRETETVFTAMIFQVPREKIDGLTQNVLLRVYVRFLAELVFSLRNAKTLHVAAICHIAGDGVEDKAIAVVRLSHWLGRHITRNRVDWLYDKISAAVYIYNHRVGYAYLRQRLLMNNRVEGQWASRKAGRSMRVKVACANET